MCETRPAPRGGGRGRGSPWTPACFLYQSVNNTQRFSTLSTIKNSLELCLDTYRLCNFDLEMYTSTHCSVFVRERERESESLSRSLLSLYRPVKTASAKGRREALFRGDQLVRERSQSHRCLGLDRFS